MDELGVLHHRAKQTYGLKMRETERGNSRGILEVWLKCIPLQFRTAEGRGLVVAMAQSIFLKQDSNAVNPCFP